MLVNGENPIKKVFLSVTGNSGTLHMADAGDTTADRVCPHDKVSTQVALLSTDMHSLQREMIDMKNQVRN
jgi:hypothetical protein